MEVLNESERKRNAYVIYNDVIQCYNEFTKINFRAE